MTQEGVYIGPSFFQYLDGESPDFEDFEDFEIQRAKEVGNVTSQSLISGGPLISCDRSRILYLVTNLNPIERDYMNEDGLDQTVSKNS